MVLIFMTIFWGYICFLSLTNFELSFPLSGIYFTWIVSCFYTLKSLIRL